MFTANTQAITDIRFKKSTIMSLLNNDNSITAEAINLKYVNDRQKGIARKRKGLKFAFSLEGKVVRDKDTLERIKKLAIPPAWKDVWICPTPDGHLQATGIDAAKRKQYLYHPLWHSIRSQTKFFHLYQFGKALPEIRKQLQDDLKSPGHEMKKVLAVIVSLMEHTGIRIGNNSYEKLYGSFGVTTLKDNHVAINGSEMKFSFKGKKGIFHNITLKSKKLARLVQHCKSIPGKELFQYFDENGVRKSIDSGMVNEYLRNISKINFTAKDFRTWNGTLCALEAFLVMEPCKNVTQTKKKILEVLDVVAEKLGNTRSVCKKYYVHPIVIDHFSNKTINKFCKNLSPLKNSESSTDLTPIEKVLMKMLEDIKVTTIATLIIK